MASSFPVHLAVAFLLVLVHQEGANESNTLDLDKLVERFAESQAQASNFKLVWVDVYGKQQEAKELRREFPAVTATAGDLVYGATKSSVTRPKTVFAQEVDNGQLSPSQTTIERKTEHKKTATWQVESGFSYSGSVSVSASVFMVDFETKHQISVDLKNGHRQEISDKETFSINQVVTVPPMKTVKLEWIITDTVKTVFWTSTVTLNGYIIVKYNFKHPAKGGMLVPYPLYFLGREYGVEDAGNNTYLYTAKGTFTGVKAYKTRLRISEYDYHPRGRRFSAVRIYTIPLKLTRTYTTAAKTL